MKIGIISDTHDNAEYLQKAVKEFNKRKVGLVIHCGDWVSPFMCAFCKDLKCKLISIFGNNEGYKQGFIQKQKLQKWNIEFNNIVAEMKVDGRKIIAYHGECIPLLKGLIDSQNYDAVFSGDTHIPIIKQKGKTLHVNPGTICGARNGKICKEYTIAIYDSKTNQAELVFLE